MKDKKPKAEGAENYIKGYEVGGYKAIEMVFDFLGWEGSIEDELIGRWRKQFTTNNN